MLGWFSEASVRASAIEAGQPLGVARERLGKDFDRDVAPSFMSRARYTSPIPPAPMLSRMSNEPSRVPADKDMG